MQVISGKYCECDNFSCLENEQKMCSGHGICDCGKCQCYENWSGDICECSLSINDCMSPFYKGSLCSGNGNCTCGKCNCSEEYDGEFCQKLRRSGEYCSILESCIKSKMLNTENDKFECRISNIELEDDVRVNAEKNEILCFTSDYCHHKFVYSFESNHIEVRVEKEKKCPETANISTIVFSIIGAILLLSIIAILLWRVLTMMYDRAKYAKFENDLKNSKFNTEENPLFKQATTTYRNPTYDLKKHIE